MFTKVNIDTRSSELYYISDDLSDDDDINKQRRTLYVQGNIIRSIIIIQYVPC